MADVTGAGRERLVDQMLEALPHAIWLLDRQGRIVRENPASRVIWGETPENLNQLGDRPAWWVATGQPVQPGEWGAARALRGGESSSDEEVLIETPAGARKTLRLSSVPLRGAYGEILGAVCLAEDITERKAREAAELQRDEQLQQTQRLEAMGRLAGGIAHDFNNLLTGMLSYSDLILQEIRPSDPIRSDVEQIRDAGQRAAGLTRQLLAFSRRQPLHPRAVSLNATVTELEPMLRRLLGAEVRLETELDPALGHAWVDPAQVEQALVNLVLNARDAMPSGGRVRIGTANVELEEESYVSLSVGDTGIGMDPATQARIFEPFFTTKHVGGGRGLGLSTVYGIVEQSGGRIAVESAPEQGSTFTIYFPRYRGTEAAIGTVPQRMPQVGTETLLLVEDEAAVRSSVRRLLEWHGYTVLEARNGADALGIYEAHQGRIDLVLTDVVMPEMGGLELVERLRARRPDLRVLFMSGYPERAFSLETMVPGTGYLEKPFTVDTLMRRLREVLDA
jgi:PAS domain S-box-containing protein